MITCHMLTWITTIVPTAVATCAALGVGGSPKGVILPISSMLQAKVNMKYNRKSQGEGTIR